jgi:hypothetical protein
MTPPAVILPKKIGAMIQTILTASGVASDRYSYPSLPPKKATRHRINRTITRAAPATADNRPTTLPARAKTLTLAKILARVRKTLRGGLSAGKNLRGTSGRSLLPKASPSRARSAVRTEKSASKSGTKNVRAARSLNEIDGPRVTAEGSRSLHPLTPSAPTSRPSPIVRDHFLLARTGRMSSETLNKHPICFILLRCFICLVGAIRKQLGLSSAYGRPARRVIY